MPLFVERKAACRVSVPFAKDVAVCRAAFRMGRNRERLGYIGHPGSLGQDVAGDGIGVFGRYAIGIGGSQHPPAKR